MSGNPSPSQEATGLVSTLRAFGWLRWRLLVNRIRSARRRDLLGRLSRWSDLVGLAVMGLGLLPLLPMVTVGAIALGWAMAGGRIAVGPDDPIRTSLRAVLAVYVFVTLIFPITVSAQRTTPAVERLLLLPIERSRLHLLRFLSALADPVLLLGAAALLLFPLGLAIGGRPGVAALSFAAGALLVLTLAAITVTIEAVLPRLLQHRRRRDTIMILLSAGVIAASLSFLAFEADAVDDFLGEAIFRLNLPGELYARVLFDALEGVLGPAALTLLALGGLTWVCYRLWTRAHERILRPDGAARRRGRRRSRASRGLWQPTRASLVVCATELRTLLRTVTGKMSVLQGSFGALMAAVIIARMEWDSALVEGIGPELLPLGAALVLTCLGLLPLQFNQFAIDGAGLTLSFLLPLSPRQLVWGRGLALGLLGGASMSLAWLITMGTVRPPLHRIVASAAFTALATTGTVLLLGSLGALVSTVFPRAVDLGRTFQQNQPHSVATLFGMAAIAGTCAVPALLVLTGVAVLHSPLWATALLSLWLLLSLTLAALLTKPASALLHRRRESLLLVAAETRT